MSYRQTPMRILFPFVGGTHFGGSHLSALPLLEGLDPARFTPVILLHDPTGPFAELLSQRGLAFHDLREVPILGSTPQLGPKGAGYPAYFARTLQALMRAITRFAVDIVHTNDGRMHANWALPTKLTGRRLVWHHRKDPTALGANRVAPLLADRIVSVSEFARPSRPVRSIGGRFTVIRSPFRLSSDLPDRARAGARLRKELGIAPEAVLLGYFGALSDRKRPLHFVRAVRAVQDALPGRAVHGALFGRVEVPESRLDARVTALAADLGIGAQIHQPGFVSPVETYMAGVDVKLVAAINEPFGRTLIEAMHVGTPVVATAHGGNIEAIRDGETGFLVDPTRPDAFVEPVAGLLGDTSLHAEIAGNAQQHVRAHFGEARHISAVSALYETLCPAPKQLEKSHA